MFLLICLDQVTYLVNWECEGRKRQRCLCILKARDLKIHPQYRFSPTQCFFAIQSWFFCEFCTNRHTTVVTLGFNIPWKMHVFCSQHTSLASLWNIKESLPTNKIWNLVIQMPLEPNNWELELNVRPHGNSPFTKQVFLIRLSTPCVSIVKWPCLSW